MPAKNHDLHGSAPDICDAALILIDVINDLEFPGGEKLAKFALPAARRIAALKRAARGIGMPVIYANDNFGRWRSDFTEAVDHCLRGQVRGRAVAELFTPDREDYFVLKPKHSAFYSTTLATLLVYLQVKRVILTGYAGDACVLLTAADAHMRDLEIVVPPDCIASRSATDNTRALAYMRRIFDADTTPSTKLDLKALAGRGRRAKKRAKR